MEKKTQHVHPIHQKGKEKEIVNFVKTSESMYLRVGMDEPPSYSSKYNNKKNIQRHEQHMNKMIQKHLRNTTVKLRWVFEIVVVKPEIRQFFLLYFSNLFIE